MDFTFSCSNCGQHITASTEYIGTEVTCPTCSHSFVAASTKGSVFETEPVVTAFQGSHPATQPTTKPCPMCGEKILVVAKKCKHCGEYLDGRKAVSASSQAPNSVPSNSLGIIILLLPVASAALMWFWISSMNLLQNPTSTLDGILIVTILLTAGLISTEASQLGMGKPLGGKKTTGPIGWFLCTLLLWIVAYPGYLFWRSKYGLKNYIVGGIASALVFLSVAAMLTYAIERQRSEALRGIPSFTSAQPTAAVAVTPITPTAAAEATPTPPSAKLEAFIREARRLASAMETGLNAEDFRAMTVELKAEGEEAMDEITDETTKADISDFLTACDDTNAVFQFLATHPAEENDQYGSVVVHVGSPGHQDDVIGGGWDTDAAKLKAHYGLDDLAPEILVMNGRVRVFSKPLPLLFAYIAKDFGKIEKDARGK